MLETLTRMALRVCVCACLSVCVSLLSLPPSLPLRCTDFAVGAPYEPDGDSTGVVYIFYGNSDITAFRNQIPARVSVCVCVCVAFLRDL